MPLRLGNNCVYAAINTLVDPFQFQFNIWLSIKNGNYVSLDMTDDSTCAHCRYSASKETDIDFTGPALIFVERGAYTPAIHSAVLS